MYDPSAWWGLSWIRDFLLLEGDEHLQMVERGDIEIEGSFPINPSGGVTSTNPIGATALLRPLEAALQVPRRRGRAPGSPHGEQGARLGLRRDLVDRVDASVARVAGEMKDL